MAQKIKTIELFKGQNLSIDGRKIWVENKDKKSKVITIPDKILNGVDIVNKGLELSGDSSHMAWAGVKKSNGRLINGVHVVKKSSRYKLGIYGEFEYNAYGQYLETTTFQFVLKAENKGLYDKVDIENPAYNFSYDEYIRASTIKKSFAYIEYKDNSKFPDRKLSLLQAYEKALELVNKGKINQGRIINIFLYEDFAFFLDEKFLSEKRRRYFKDIERSILSKKYQMGARKSTRNGAIKSSFIQDGIIRRVDKEAK